MRLPGGLRPPGWRHVLRGRKETGRGSPAREGEGGDCVSLLFHPCTCGVPSFGTRWEAHVSETWRHVADPSTCPEPRGNRKATRADPGLWMCHVQTPEAWDASLRPGRRRDKRENGEMGRTEEIRDTSISPLSFPLSRLRPFLFLFLGTLSALFALCRPDVFGLIFALSSLHGTESGVSGRDVNPSRVSHC